MGNIERFKTNYYSYKLNNLAKGCELCIQGRKSVFFITGICPERCFYCPISDQKKDNDVIYMNEWPNPNEKEIIQEIINCKSKGVGITGGDPLARLERTLNWIKKLKKRFGRKFHIHLYTPLTLVNEKTLKRLYDAGLDEIRFHPNIECLKVNEWSRIKKAKELNWKVGVEIPIIPGKEKEVKQLIDYLAEIGIDFLNLNEFEYSDTNHIRVAEKGFKTKDNQSYGIKGSLDLGRKLLDYIHKNYPKMNLHICTAKLKDSIQMRNRIKLRAQSIKTKYDEITKDGTIIKGAIYLIEMLPGDNHRKKIGLLSEKRKKILLQNLSSLRLSLAAEFLEDIGIDKENLRLILPKKSARKIAKSIDTQLFKIALIEEYPTYDQFLIELEYLN